MNFYLYYKDDSRTKLLVLTFGTLNISGNKNLRGKKYRSFRQQNFEKHFTSKDYGYGKTIPLIISEHLNISVNGNATKNMRIIVQGYSS